MGEEDETAEERSVECMKKGRDVTGRFHEVEPDPVDGIRSLIRISGMVVGIENVIAGLCQEGAQMSPYRATGSDDQMV